MRKKFQHSIKSNLVTFYDDAKIPQEIVEKYQNEMNEVFLEGALPQEGELKKNEDEMFCIKTAFDIVWEAIRISNVDIADNKPFLIEMMKPERVHVATENVFEEKGRQDCVAFQTNGLTAMFIRRKYYLFKIDKLRTVAAIIHELMHMLSVSHWKIICLENSEYGVENIRGGISYYKGYSKEFSQITSDFNEALTEALANRVIFVGHKILKEKINISKNNLMKMSWVSYSEEKDRFEVFLKSHLEHFAKPYIDMNYFNGYAKQIVYIKKYLKTL